MTVTSWLYNFRGGFNVITSQFMIHKILYCEKEEKKIDVLGNVKSYLILNFECSITFITLSAFDFLIL